MDRRRLVKAFVAAVIGVRVVDVLMPDGSRELGVSPWPATQPTQEMLDDAASGYAPQRFPAQLQGSMDGNKWVDIDYAAMRSERYRVIRWHVDLPKGFSGTFQTVLRA